MHLTQLVIHDGVLGEMCAKSPEVFLEKKVRQRAETIRDYPFQEGRETKRPEGLQCGSEKFLTVSSSGVRELMQYGC